MIIREDPPPSGVDWLFYEVVRGHAQRSSRRLAVSEVDVTALERTVREVEQWVALVAEALAAVVAAAEAVAVAVVAATAPGGGEAV